MRRVADFDHEKLALRFWGYLKKEGVEASLEQNESEEKKGWEIWVTEEDQVNSAISLLHEFQANPEDEKFISNYKSEKKPETNNGSSPKRFKEFNLREKWQRHDRSTGTITLSIIITCVAVFLLSGMGRNTELVGSFFMSEKMDGHLSEFLSG